MACTPPGGAVGALKTPPSTCQQQGQVTAPQASAAGSEGSAAVPPFCAACQNLQVREDGGVDFPEDVWDFLADHNLVLRSVTCPWCKHEANLARFLSFCCRRMTQTVESMKIVTRRCCFTVSAHKGTFFEHSKLSLQKIMCLCYWFVLDTLPHESVSKKVDVPFYKLIFWYSFCQETIINYCLSNCKKIGGPGKFVKITEARVREKKHCGPRTKSQWVLGGFEKDSQSFFLTPIPDRKNETLKECIKQWVLPGTTIVTDSWAMCSYMSFEGYQLRIVYFQGSNNSKSNATPQDTGQESHGSHQGIKVMEWPQEQYVGQLSRVYFQLAFPNPLERFHQFLKTVARLYPPQEGKCSTGPLVTEKYLVVSKIRLKSGTQVERQTPRCADGGVPVLSNRLPHTGVKKAAEPSSVCTFDMMEKEKEKSPLEAEMVIDEKEDTSSAAQDPLALSPQQPAAWEEEEEEEEEEELVETGYLPSGPSEYMQSLSTEQLKQYLAKLTLKKYNMTLPDPYNLTSWETNEQIWPDLNGGHIHQYLLCSQGRSPQGMDVATIALEGYNIFKLGNVVEVESSRVQSNILVCFLSARVIPMYECWVCLEETEGIVLTSHCSCLTRFTDVCGHIVALLFRVEAAVSLGVNQKDPEHGSSKLAVWDKYYRPAMSVSRVRDIDFVHPNSSKRLKLLYQRVKPKPLSQSEQVEALSELKRILPNAPIFMAGNPDSPKASMPVDSHPLDPTLAILEDSAGVEDSDVCVKLEFDEAETPFRREAPPREDYLELPQSMEAEVSVKTEDDIFIKMEEIEDDAYVIESW